MKMKSLVCCALFWILAGFAHAEPQVILDTDFGVPGKAFAEINAAKGIRITGSLPEGWGDNSNWKNNVVAEYRPMSEGGRRFLRVRQTSGDGLQFMHRLPGMEKKNGYYRLTFTARSLTGVSLGVRDLGAALSHPVAVHSRHRRPVARLLLRFPPLPASPGDRPVHLPGRQWQSRPAEAQADQTLRAGPDRRDQGQVPRGRFRQPGECDGVPAGIAKRLVDRPRLLRRRSGAGGQRRGGSGPERLRGAADQRDRAKASASTAPPSPCRGALRPTCSASRSAATGTAT